MGDEKDTWKVKTLDEILLEKKRRKELQEKTDPKRQKNVKYLKANIHSVTHACWHRMQQTDLWINVLGLSYCHVSIFILKPRC